MAFFSETSLRTSRRTRRGAWLLRAALALLFGSSFALTPQLRAMTLPPIDGEFSGQFTALKIPGAPALRWTVRVRTTKPAERVVDLAVDGTGTRVRAQLGVDNDGNGWWKLTEAELDAAAWFPAASSQVGSAAAGVAAKGRIELAGAGALVDGRPNGTLTFAWRDGALVQAADGWSLEGIALRGELVIETAGEGIKSLEPMELTVRTVSTARFGARNFLLKALLNADKTVALTESRIEIAGGHVTIEPTTLPLDPLAVAVTLRITNVGLQDVAALVPAGLSESRGRINGTVRLGWSEANGFQLGEGNLVLGSTEPAFVRLAPSPGFLSERVGPRISLLPDSFGVVARWFQPKNPAYPEMQAIELGRTELRIENLSVQLTPQGDDQGRTARVKATARPAHAGGVVESVTFEVNVSGPLTQVLKLGMNQSFSVETR